MACTEATLRRLAFALPEVTEAPHFDMHSFRVRGKIIATVPASSDRVHLFVGADEVAAYCAEYPGVVEELWWGQKLSGCRVQLKNATAGLLRELLTEAWRRKAPKKLLAQFDAERNRTDTT
jgi:hypothetical protein